jgi:GntR family transcriptional regulator
MTGLATPEDVRRTLARQIVAGELRPGQRLGAERALAADLGVSRALLRQALSILEDGGMIRRVPGRGGGTSGTCRRGSRGYRRCCAVRA